jgi:REP element-mobilizing transposase RayT
MVRGIERCQIFRSDAEGEDLVARLSGLVEATGLAVHAWALLPNHLHLLVQTGRRPLATAMRRLLTGYAVTFKRRHRRHGHLFQNRYRSIVVEAERYGRELVRYLPLDPLRAGVVPSLAALDRYPWTGHSATVGRVPRAWQSVASVLARFGPTRAVAQRRPHAP